MFAKVIARWLSPSLLLFAAGWLSLAAQDLRFQHITTDDGLSDNAITCVFEDHEGFIWIGTENGLNRYDGQRVVTFPPGTTGPEGAHITAIAEDGLGRLWVSTADGGLSMRDPASRSFTHYRKDGVEGHRLPTDLLNHVLVVHDSLLVLSSRNMGAIWFNTRSGVAVPRGFREVGVDAKGDTIARSYNAWCHTVLRLDEKRLWTPMIGGLGSYIMDVVTGDRLASITRSTAGPAMVMTNGLRIGDVLYAGGWTPGIMRIQLDQGYRPTLLPLEEEITAMVPWGEGTLLAATKLNGLLLVEPSHGIVRRWHHTRNDHASLINDRVRCLRRDRNGNLWVGTAEGLSVFDPAVWPFKITPLQSDEEPGDIVFHKLQQDGDGTLRISTSRGFYLVDPYTGDLRHVPLEYDGLPLAPTGLFRVESGATFIGTETGLFRYDPAHERLSTAEGKAFVRYYDKALFQVRSVHQDTFPQGPRLVVGALGYAHNIVDPVQGIRDERTALFPQPRRPAMLIKNTIRDRHGAYWMATSAGLARWVPERPGRAVSMEVFATDMGGQKHIAGNDVTAVLLVGDTVWAAMRDAGLARVIDGTAESFAPPAHIPHDAFGLAADARGRIWYTTSNGLVRFDPRSMEWLHVPVNDGHDFRRLNSCILTLADGRIAFCADRHLITFDPRAFDALPVLPLPALVEVKNTWGPIPISEDAEVEIPYRSSSFDAVITALQPTATGPLEFVYRLEGVDADARSTAAREAIRYAGVPVGAHRLLVRVRDGYGREGPEHALLTVTVIGPFWQRWWFFLLVLGAGALGMYLVSRLRQRQRMKLQGVRDRIARDLHDDIGSTLGSISFYSEALKRKLGDTDDAMAQQVADKIGASSRDMIDQMSDIVWSVDPKNDDAGALGTRLQAFAGDLLATKGITLHFVADPALNDRKLSAEQRRNLFLICKEALHNAVKYADARNVTITMKSTGRALKLDIADDGKGFDPANTDSYNGNGIPNMRVRAEAIGASFTIESSPGTGTRARLSVPQNMLPRSGD